jgi:hypothetical protein
MFRQAEARKINLEICWKFGKKKNQIRSANSNLVVARGYGRI